MTENTSKFAIIKATDKVDAQTTAKFIPEDILSSYGIPTEIQMDLKIHFVAESLKQLKKPWGWYIELLLHIDK